MSQDDIHASLENARVAAEDLVSEMGTYSTAKELREFETKALSHINETLAETAELIRPYREVQMRRFRTLVMGGIVLNLILLIAMFVLVILRT